MYTSRSIHVHDIVKKFACYHVVNLKVISCSNYLLRHTFYMYIYFFALPKDPQSTLKCNTKKDVHGRLNYRTAGTIVMYLICIYTNAGLFVCVSEV